MNLFSNALEKFVVCLHTGNWSTNHCSVFHYLINCIKTLNFYSKDFEEQEAFPCCFNTMQLMGMLRNGYSLLFSCDCKKNIWLWFSIFSIRNDVTHWEFKFHFLIYFYISAWLYIFVKLIIELIYTSWQNCKIK